MSSPGDPAYSPEGSRHERMYVPQGPMWDAWTAPDGGAVKLTIQAMKMQARWLRRARPRPFGFAPGSACPTPVHLVEAHGAGTLSSGAASLLGLGAAVHTMSVSYGHTADPRAPAAVIISDLHRDYQDRDLQDALMETVAQWPVPAEAADAAGGEPAAGSRPEITTARIEVVVSGGRRAVFLLRLGDLSAFQTYEEGVLVTVMGRHIAPELPELVRLRSADLEPMLSAMENPDKELIGAALADQRRRHIEQMRNQTGHRP
jgi:hypothetical protein